MWTAGYKITTGVAEVDEIVKELKFSQTTVGIANFFFFIRNLTF